MILERRAFLGAGLAFLTASTAAAEEWVPAPSASLASGLWPPPESLPLWPGDPPGRSGALPVPVLNVKEEPSYRQVWICGIASPQLHVFRPERPNGSAILVIPGGSYSFVAIQNEGLDVARRYTPTGVTVILLSYRLPGEGWAHRADVPLQDAQRAMRLIRSNAGAFGIDPARLGVVGFSAGGHLAATLTTAYAEGVYDPVDAADSLSARPAFAGLIYPVISVRSPLAHQGSRDNLLGPSPSADKVNDRSPSLHVTAETPPCFLVHAIDDQTVAVENSLEMFQALRAAKVAAELHLFETGGHGFGVHLPSDLPASHWPELLTAWIDRHRQT